MSGVSHGKNTTISYLTSDKWPALQEKFSHTLIIVCHKNYLHGGKRFLDHGNLFGWFVAFVSLLTFTKQSDPLPNRGTACSYPT